MQKRSKALEIQAKNEEIDNKLNRNELTESKSKQKTNEIWNQKNDNGKKKKREGEEEE